MVIIKSILIHEYQDKSSRVNTSQHELTRIRHESTRTKTSLTQINTSPTSVNTNQNGSTRYRHESTRINTSSRTGLDHEKEKNMAKRKNKT